MSSTQLKRAGILAMVSALLAIPWFLIIYAAEAPHGIATKLAGAGILLAGAGIYIYLISLLRRFIHFRCSFTAADPYISILIKGNVVIAAIGVLGLLIPYIESSVAIVTVILAIPLGIVQVMFGNRLRALPDDLNGLRTPYAMLTMITGVCQAAIYLMPIALFTGAVADVMLGTVFLQAAAQLARKSK